MMFDVTDPSSVARQGTIAGTQVRFSSMTEPTLTGVNSRDRSASSAVGQRASGIACLTGFSGCHIGLTSTRQKSEGRRRKAEVRSQRSEVRGQRSEVRGQSFKMDDLHAAA